MAIKNYLINDKWLDIDKQNIVEVKSTDGVIGSIKLNGEEYGGSGGGGESDFSTAEVTFENVDTTTRPYRVSVSTIEDDMIKTVVGDVLNPVTVTVPLYKGTNILPASCISSNAQSYMPTTEGSIEFSIESFGFIVTGDGTIKAKGLAGGA